MQGPTPHPAKGILAMRRITNRRVDSVLDMNPLFVGRVLNGYDKPTPRFRAGLSALLGLPESALFRDEDADEFVEGVAP